MPVGDIDRLGVASERFEPLARLAVRQIIEAEIRRGMQGGINPLVIARAIRLKASGVTLTRAMTIARTEMMVASWSTTRDEYARDEVVTGWQWSATRDGKTCPTCTMMDGTIHSNGDRMRSHPNCRCAMLPVVSGRASIGSTGFSRVARMSKGRQSALLGPSRANYLQAGGDPTALVSTATHPLYGPTPVLTRVRDLP